MTLHQLWEYLAPALHRRLGLFILLSFFVHAIPFLILRTAPGSLRLSSLPQPQVIMLSASVPNAEAMAGELAWFDLFDPRMLASTTSQLPLEKLLPPSAIESTIEPFSPESFLKPIPSRIKPARLLENRSPLNERIASSISPPMSTPSPLPLESPPSLSGTQVSLEELPAERPPTHQPALPRPRSSLALSTTSLHIAISPEGIVSHALVDESCGDSSIDALAVKHLKDWRFRKAPSEGTKTQWARARVFWDFQPPAPKSP